MKFCRLNRNSSSNSLPHHNQKIPKQECSLDRSAVLGVVNIASCPNLDISYHSGRWQAMLVTYFQVIGMGRGGGTGRELGSSWGLGAAGGEGGGSREL